MNLRPSWWDSVILIATPILFVIGSQQGVDPSTVADTTELLDEGIWLFGMNVWELFGALIATVRGVIAGWRRAESPDGGEIVASKLMAS